MNSPTFQVNSKTHESGKKKTNPYFHELLVYTATKSTKNIHITSRHFIFANAICKK